MENLTDEKLYDRCKFYGKLALNYRNKFIGLLPEVNRRKLYEQKGFSSIFEFAAKLAGVSQKQVQRVLQLDKKFADKPAIHEALVTGEISTNKLVRIASIATVENQEILLDQSKLLNCRALETFVRDEKHAKHQIESESQDGLFEAQNMPKSVHVHTSLKLSPEVISKLSELQNKGLDINGLILKFLKEREEKIESEKAKISAQTRAKENSEIASAKKPSRYIPAKTKKLLNAIHGTKCAIAHCQKPAKEIHHTVSFALNKAHDPNFLAPLCREHHAIAHTINQKVVAKRMLVGI